MNPGLCWHTLEVLPKPVVELLEGRVWEKKELSSSVGLCWPRAPRLSRSTAEPCPALSDKQSYIKGNMKTQLIRSHRVD